MKAVYDREFVLEHAQLAVKHWDDLFHKCRQEWLDRRAAQTKGFFVKRPIGYKVAEDEWNDSIFEGGQSGGVFTYEYGRYCQALTLVDTSSKPGAKELILNDREIYTLLPVMEK